MASTTQTGTATTTHTEPSGWSGWITFAGLMMIISGTMNATYGFIALVNDQWVVWGTENILLIDVTGWGWVHLILGVIVALAGIGVMTGNLAARIVGVTVAAGSMLVNFVALPVYPFWSLVLITVDVVIIWALIVHGRERKEAF